MLLDPDSCYQALKAHDVRFDGRFFVGVATTGIYCRPVCTVKAPKREHCTFFPNAAAAERAGYRPCLRCRPELAPGYASVDAGKRLAQAAANLIEDGLLFDARLDALAARLGVSDRHLRRVFRSELGVTPIEFAQTQRLLLAKRLLTDTAMPVLDVAFAAGFGSLRRFNALFRSRYRLNPSELRKATSPETEGILRFELGYRPPYAWEAIIGFLGERAIEGVEAVADGRYRRAVALAHGERLHTGWIEVEQEEDKHALSVRLSGSLSRVIPQVLGRVKRLFDLDCRPEEVAERLGPLAARLPGLRVPGAFDGFEMAVRAVLGQQIAVKAARRLAGRFAAAFGTPIATPFPSIGTVFPTAAQVESNPTSAIMGIGVARARSLAIAQLARACAAGEIALDDAADVQQTLAALRALPGIGEWTAQYLAMRALSWPDAFPHTDYGVLKALGETRPSRALARAEAWRPWRAYATLYLWETLKETVA